MEKGVGSMSYAEPSVKIAPTVMRCFKGMCRPTMVGIGRMMMMPSVTMLRTAWEMAMLFRQTMLSGVPRSGLQGPENKAVKVTV